MKHTHTLPQMEGKQADRRVCSPIKCPVLQIRVAMFLLYAHQAKYGYWYTYVYGTVHPSSQPSSQPASQPSIHPSIRLSICPSTCLRLPACLDMNRLSEDDNQKFVGLKFRLDALVTECSKVSTRFGQNLKKFESCQLETPYPQLLIDFGTTTLNFTNMNPLSGTPLK